MPSVRYDDLWICTDCLMWIANGDASGVDDETRARVTDPAHDSLGYWVPTDGVKEFSWGACRRCGSSLGGERHGAAILVDDAPADMMRAYVECALWASTDHNDCVLDSAGYTADDIDPAGRARMADDLAAFLHDAGRAAPDWRECWTGEQFGHDFWLTRNRHGAGFWGRYLDGRGAEIGHILTDLAHGWGEQDIMEETEDYSGGLFIA